VPNPPGPSAIGGAGTAARIINAALGKRRNISRAFSRAASRAAHRFRVGTCRGRPWPARAFANRRMTSAGRRVVFMRASSAKCNAGLDSERVTRRVNSGRGAKEMRETSRRAGDSGRRGPGWKSCLSRLSPSTSPQLTIEFLEPTIIWRLNGRRNDRVIDLCTLLPTSASSFYYPWPFLVSPICS
jgi:hypothetical protein